MLRRPGAHHFGERREADAHQLASRALLRLFFKQRFVTDFLERHVQRLVIVAAVVGETERRRIGELICADEILLAQLHRVHAQLVGQNIQRARSRKIAQRERDLTANAGIGVSREARGDRQDVEAGAAHGAVCSDPQRRIRIGLGRSRSLTPFRTELIQKEDGAPAHINVGIVQQRRDAPAVEPGRRVGVRRRRVRPGLGQGPRRQPRRVRRRSQARTFQDATRHRPTRPQTRPSNRPVAPRAHRPG